MTNLGSRLHRIAKSSVPGMLLMLTVLLPVTSTAGSTVQLVTGKTIASPPLGTQQNVGSLPMNMILSPNGKFVVVTDMGFRQSLSSLDATTGALVSQIDYPNNTVPTNGLYYGLAFGNSTTLYVAQGGNDSIDVVHLSDIGALFEVGSIKTKTGDFPSGLATDSRGYLYVANNDPATFAVASSVAIYSESTQTEVGRYSFSSSYFGTPNFPPAIATLADGSKTYVASERDGVVYVLNTSDPTNPTLIRSIPTGANPDGLLLNGAQTLLYVANGGSDTVSVVSTSTDTVVTSILLRPAKMQNVVGTSTPTGLALSPDGKTLYVALGDLNSVASLHVSGSTLSLNGYIPAGWYPSSVVAAGKNLLVANAKGTTPYYPNPGYIQFQFGASPYYDQNLIEGNVSFISNPHGQQLVEGTQAVLEHYESSRSNPDSELGALLPAPGSIKHVIYIVKENRTYDQVLGDIPGGNGDPSIVLFGSTITPNQHALAQRFVLLDNFYVNAEVSFDGLPWSTQAIANEYLIKNVPYNYSGRGRNYDGEGQDNGYLTGGFPPKDPDGNQLSFYFPNGAPAIPDVAEGPGQHIWDAVNAAKLTYRNYGFFYSFGIKDSSGNVIMPDNYPAVSGIQPPGHDLAGLSDFDFRRYDASYADSEAPMTYSCPYSRPAYGKYNAPSRYSEWVREFNEMLTNDPTGNSVPQFMTVRLMHDHTQGMSSGKFTPSAEVADNDYAVGQLVQAVSQSPIWTSTAIFIVEDDAQDGPDHVDCHRSTAYVISPWIKQSSIDHSFHNTTGVLSTMEMLLGLSPLTSYDAVAAPINDWDTKPKNNAPYTAVLPAQSIVCSKTANPETLSPNDPRRSLILESDGMDFDTPDSAPDRRLNEIIWKSVKGPGSEPPAPRHATGSQDKDDD